jgi:hypothetical protein
MKSGDRTGQLKLSRLVAETDEQVARAGRAYSNEDRTAGPIAHALG